MAQGNDCSTQLRPRQGTQTDSRSVLQRCRPSRRNSASPCTDSRLRALSLAESNTVRRDHVRTAFTLPKVVFSARSSTDGKYMIMTPAYHQTNTAVSVYHVFDMLMLKRSARARSGSLCTHSCCTAHSSQHCNMRRGQAWQVAS